MDYPLLNLPDADLRIKETGENRHVFDVVRRQFVTLTPEEWVRQHFLHFIIRDKHYPASLIGVEMLVKVNNLSQRADLVVYSREGKPWMIIECKAPAVQMDENVFYQAARYNLPLQVQYFVVTNGLEHYCLHFNGSGFDYLEDLPEYPDVTR